VWIVFVAKLLPAIRITAAGQLRHSHAPQLSFRHNLRAFPKTVLPYSSRNQPITNARFRDAQFRLAWIRFQFFPESAINAQVAGLSLLLAPNFAQEMAVGEHFAGVFFTTAKQD